jgi:hypothetical protein
MRIEDLPTVIEGQTIKLAGLFDMTKPNVIEGKTFRDCHLIGPANVWLAGLGTIHGGLNLRDCDLVCIKIPVSINTAIQMTNCSLMDCTFDRVLLMMDGNVARNFKFPASRFITEVLLPPMGQPSGARH